MIVSNRRGSKRPKKESLFFFASIVALIFIWRNNFQLIGNSTTTIHTWDGGDWKRNEFYNFSIVDPKSDMEGSTSSSVKNNASRSTGDNQHQQNEKQNSDSTKQINHYYVPSHNPKFHFKKKMSPDLIRSFLNITYKIKEKRRVDFTFTIKKDISSFLNYAIIGMPKTGTTSIYRLLSNHIIPLDKKERCDLVVNDIPLLLNDLYYLQGELNKGSNHAHHSTKYNLIGMKCPQDISSFTSLQNYASYFPQTKLIVGLRHPIKWFESFYNFQVRNMYHMISTDELLDRCVKGSHGVCAWRANVVDFLYQLNKTTHGSVNGSIDEKYLMEQNQYLSLKNVKRVQGNVGKIFMYIIDQLEEDETMEKPFLQDLFQFLELDMSTSSTTMNITNSTQNNDEEDNIPIYVPKINTAGAMDHIPGMIEHTKQNMIRICDDEHKQIRAVLMDKAQKASMWIREYFLKSADVYVSSQKFIDEKLKEWMYDPCEIK